ncbi:MAG: hypothetical protein LBB60_04255 [Desulfovibrio sp.]|jgi:hypothetical protein|nr:hypothetical protein [Desulfovibrio sp.]
MKRNSPEIQSPPDTAQQAETARHFADFLDTIIDLAGIGMWENRWILAR